MQLSQSTVVVTGAAGFLGSHLCDALLTAGAHVIGIDNLITGRESNLVQARAKGNQFTFVNADASRLPTSYLPLLEHVDAVLHFASPASPPRYQAHPVETYLVNSTGTHHWLSWIKEHSPDTRFLFASTSEVYGDPQVSPQSESYWGNVNPNGIRACYDEGKRLGETICGIHARDFKLDVRIVRIFNTYGPRINPVDGRVIPNFVSQTLNSAPLVIHGDGSITRSLCYVDDLVDGLIKYLTIDGLAGETINLGNTVELNLLEIGKTVWQAVRGPDSQPVFSFIPGAPDDPQHRCPDTSKAKQLLQWDATTTLQQGIRPTIEFLKDEMDRSL